MDGDEGDPGLRWYRSRRDERALGDAWCGLCLRALWR